MKILIVDDEPLARKRLARLLLEIGDCEVVGEAANGKQALLSISALNPDIVLLDISMPEMDGLEAALHLSKLPDPPAIIFVTAYSDHALAAFETRAVDYLLKPIRKDRLQRAIANARRLNRAQISNLKPLADQPQARSHISVNVRGNIQLIPISDIIYFQAEQKYIIVRYSTGQVLIDDSLKALEDEFGELFLRTHRGTLVAIAFIVGIVKDRIGRRYITMRNIDDRLEISRRHASSVRKCLKRIQSLATT